MSETRLIQAAETLAAAIELSELEQIAALRQDGFEEGEAHRLVAFLPMAFSRPVLEELGVRNFAPEVFADDADGTRMTAKLMRQPEYSGGLRLARAHRKRGIMNHEVYKRIAGSSAEIDVASKALNEGVDIAGATIASALLSAAVSRYLVK